MDFEVKLEDIPENQRDIAECLGIEAFIKLSKFCGGQTGIYIPKYYTLIKEARNRVIRQRYNKYNLKQLAREYCLSTQSIRQIVAEKGK